MAVIMIPVSIVFVYLIASHYIDKALVKRRKKVEYGTGWYEHEQPGAGDTSSSYGGGCSCGCGSGGRGFQ